MRALARVNLAAIERNSRACERAAAGAELCAVVKADGYGHGAAPAARAALAGGATLAGRGHGPGGARSCARRESTRGSSSSAR